MESESSENNKLIEYVDFIFRWRVFFIVHFIAVSIFAVVLSLIIPKTFTSSAVIVPPEGQTQISGILPSDMMKGLGGNLGSLIGGSSGAISGGGAHRILSILNSRSLAVKTIKEFDLQQKFESPTIEDAILAFRDLFSITQDEYGTISVTVSYDTDFFHAATNEKYTRNIAKDICDFIIKELDRKYTALNTQKAKYERKEIAKRLKKNKADLNRIEKEIKRFTTENGMIALPEQIKATVQAAAQIESKILMTQIELETLRESYASKRSEVKQKSIMVNQMKAKLQELKLKGPDNDSLAVFPSFERAPSLFIKYARLQRELEVQSILYEFYSQQFEQIKLQETKDTPSLLFIDTPVVPTKRTSPTRSILVIVLVSIGMLFGLGYTIIYDQYSSDINAIYGHIKQK